MTTLLVSESLAKSHVNGYTKTDGTVVKPHDDKRTKAAKPPAKWSSGFGASAGGTLKAPQYGASKPPQSSLWGGHGGSSASLSKNAPKPEPKAWHPKPGDKGQKVGIYNPHIPALAELKPFGGIATITPGCEMPAELWGVPFGPWTPPASDDQWDYVEGVKDDLVEPPLHCPVGKLPASGLVIVEPDGRVWVVSPTNKFGNYKNTFPKGKVEEEMSFQANAIKEAWEEAGIKADVVKYLGDVERTTSVTRYYLARRTGGNPAQAMTWESQAVHLCPISQLKEFLDAKVDHQVADLLAG